MSECKEKGYHGNLTTKYRGTWECRDCGATEICSLCGKDKDGKFTSDLYDMAGEQICQECYKTEKPISEKLKMCSDMSHRDFVIRILELEKQLELVDPPPQR